MHTYTVAFRAAGERLNIKQVSELLGLTPTHIINVGDAQSRGPSAKAVWSFEVFSRSGGEWHILEDALVELLSIFEPRVNSVRQLQDECEVFLWCGYFTSSVGGGPQFSPALLRRVADFGVELFLDTYCSQD